MDRCPSPETLRRALDNRLESAKQAAVEAHVDRCPACQAMLDAGTDDAEVRRWRSLMAPPEAGDENDLDVGFLSAIKQEPPSAEAGVLDREERSQRPTIRFSGPPTALGPLGRLGRYHICREIGAGAAGFVYLAQDERDGRRVAIKVLRPELAAGLHGRLRFEREARVAASLQHEHLVPVLEIGGSPDFPLPFLVMEYIAGESLAERLQRDGSLPHREAVLIGRQIATGLACAHRRGLVHRDVKPSNILLDATSGLARITDFGIARVEAGSNEATNGRFTQSGHIVGTPAYMSPEQISQPDEVDARSDVYSLGVVLYEMLMGERPFRGSSPTVLHHIIERDPLSLRSIGAGIPRELATIVETCMAKDATRRYSSADELAAELGRWLDGEPIVARPAGAIERTARWARRRPWVAAFWSVLAVSVAVVLGLTWGHSIRLGHAMEELQREMHRTDAQRRLAQKQLAKSQVSLQREGVRSAERLIGQHRYDDAFSALVTVPGSRRGWEWRRMAHEVALALPPTRVIGTHEWGISAMLRDHSGRSLVTSGQDGRLIRWDTESNQAAEMGGGSWSEALQCWRHVRIPMMGDSPPNALAPDCFQSLCWLREDVAVIAASLGGKGTVWPLNGGSPREILSHDRPLTAVACSGDTGRVAFGDDRGRLIVCDTAGHQKTVESLGESAILVVLPFARGLWVAGQEDGTLTLIDMDNRRVLDQLGLRGPVWNLDLAPDRPVFAVACGENRLVTFSVESPAHRVRAEETYSLPLADDKSARRALQCVRFSPDGRWVAAGNDLGQLILWERGDHEPRLVIKDKFAARPAGDDLAKLPAPLRRRLAGLQFAPDSQSLFTAGIDSSVQRLSLGRVLADHGVTTFQVGLEPKVRFDPTNATLLWAGSSDGTIALWNSRTGERLFSLDTHGGPVVGIDSAPRAKLVITCGADRTVRFWKRAGDQIEEVGQKITHHRPLRDIALSPDGKRVAAYDEDDEVVLWDVGSARHVSTVSLRQKTEGHAIRGLVAFNCDGDVLGATGPGQACRLFEGATLANPRSIYLVSGKGGTALAWHPTDPTRIVGGDSQGLIRSFPESPESFVIGVREMQGSVVGVGFTPSGDRVAAGSRDGTVSIMDPVGASEVLRLPSRFPNATDVRFDTEGRRLAVVHGDGEVVIWETETKTEPIDVRAPRRWNETVLLKDTDTRHFDVRVGNTALDKYDRVSLVHTTPSTRPEQPIRQSVCLGHESGSGLLSDTLEDVGELDPRSMSALWTSLALLEDGERCWVAFRRPGPAVTGQLVLIRHPVHPPVASIRPEERRHPCEILVKRPDHSGLETILLPGAAEFPTVLHFDYAGHYLRRTYRHEGQWHTETIGRRGDGFRARAAVGPDRRLHLVFWPMRPGGIDPGRLVYLSTGQPETRETVDPSLAMGVPFSVGATSLAIDPQGNPVVVFERPAAGGYSEVVVMRRQERIWSQRVVLPTGPDSFSNVSCDAHGRVRFAWVDRRSHRIVLATGLGDAWRFEKIWEAGDLEEFPNDEEPCIGLVVLQDSQNRPVIVAVRRSREHGWLRVFRPGAEW